MGFITPPAARTGDSCSSADSDDIEERPWRQLLHHAGRDPNSPQLTCRAVLAGLVVGTMLCFTNMYFGLQTGWVTMGSVQCALVGFGIFQLPCFQSGGRRFGPLENVVLQTVGVATATLPLAGGFVGILPALSMLDPPVVLSVPQQLAWAAALTYFGIFFAVPLRRQTILVEQLAFPSGTATAKLIDLLHGAPAQPALPSVQMADSASEGESRQARPIGPQPAANAPWRTLAAAFFASFALAAASTFLRPAADQSFHVFSWVGLPALTSWRWTLRPQLSLVGQGMIMGPRSAFSLLLGAIIAWGILGPLARRSGWAPGPIGDFESGAQGWVLWLSIGLMLAESLTAFTVVIIQQVLLPLTRGTSDRGRGRSPAGPDAEAEAVEVAPPSQLVPTSWWVSGVIGAVALCVGVLSPMFSLPPVQVVIATALSCLVAVLAVRPAPRIPPLPSLAVVTSRPLEVAPAPPPFSRMMPARCPRLPSCHLRVISASSPRHLRVISAPSPRHLRVISAPRSHAGRCGRSGRRTSTRSLPWGRSLS